MATYQKRGSSWTATIRRKGVFKSATFPVKAQAQAWATKTEADILAGKSGSIPDKTFSELLDEYVKKVSVTKKGERWERVRIELIKRDEISQVKLSDLNTTHFAAWRDRRLKTVTTATVRREWVLLSHACNIAINEWKWLQIHPMKGIKLPAHTAPRDRIATDDEIKLILFSLGYDYEFKPIMPSQRVGAAVIFALETGMRAGEIVALQWEDILLDKKYCRVGDGKTLAARRNVPLSPGALRLLNQIKEESGSVFNLSSAQVDVLFRKGRTKAGVDGLHFHDLRHTAVTRLAKKIDVLELAKMIGHRDLKMLMVYYSADAESLADKL